MLRSTSPALGGLALTLALALASACAPAKPPPTAPASDTDTAIDADAERSSPDPGALPGSTMERAQVLAQRLLLIDGHIDVPDRLHDGRAADGSLTEDILRRTPRGDFDYPRARDGGLDAPFFSIYVPASLQSGGAKAYADGLIDMVESLAQADAFALASSVAELEQNFAAGTLTLLLGIENGAALEGDLANVEHFYRRGVRYITMTHSKDNRICDSSYDDARTWKGLSPFGAEVVAEMNRVGLMVDISHVSDQAFTQILAATKAPVIASHSSARHFTPGFERNMSDEMIRALAQQGGVIMVNFGSGFLTAEARAYGDAFWAERRRFAAAQGLDPDDPAVEAHLTEWRREHPRVYADLSDVADHVDHIVGLVGVDHVGLGSDFDGVGDSLPTGLKDVSAYPNLLRELLERGYSEDDLAKICGQNLLRVWRAVEAQAAAQRQEAPR